MARRTGNALSAFLAMALVLVAIGAQAESHVRIIRLSYIDGSVQMDRATGQGMEKAILNTPVTEGARLTTGNDGLAEVEFENNSTIRLGEDSEVQFTKLLIDDSGVKVNEVSLLKGTAYFDTKSGKDEVYRAKVGDSVFLLHRDTQLRLSDDDGNPKLSVLKGEVELQNSQRDVKVGKKETLTVDPNSASGYEIAKGVDAQPLDNWNNERAAYQQAYSYNNVGVSSGLNSYGYSDLNYYGGWSYLPGIGYGWQPYGVADWMGWNPYLAGAWAFYPGFGYTWASAYPWGWLPYHYGSWSYLGNGGWFWLPGGGNFYRNGWYNNGFQPMPIVHGPPGWVPPRQPPVPVAGVGRSAYAPTVRVGTIGNLPPAIPGGRMAPNFRSVIPNTADRALNVPGRIGAPYAPPTGNHGARAYVPPTGNRAGSMPVAASADTRAIYGKYAGSTVPRPGHVFAPPVRSTYGGYGMGGYGAMSHGGGYGMGMGPAMGGSHAMGPSSGGGHGMGGGGGHGGGGGGHGGPR